MSSRRRTNRWEEKKYDEKDKGLEEKVFVGLDKAPPAFDLRNRILGEDGSNLEWIRKETECTVWLRGRGKEEPMHFVVKHKTSRSRVREGRKLIKNLIETLRIDLQQFFVQFPGIALQGTDVPAGDPSMLPSVLPMMGIILPPSAIPGFNDQPLNFGSPAPGFSEVNVEIQRSPSIQSVNMSDSEDVMIVESAPNLQQKQTTDSQKPPETPVQLNTQNLQSQPKGLNEKKRQNDQNSRSERDSRNDRSSKRDRSSDRRSRRSPHDHRSDRDSRRLMDERNLHRSRNSDKDKKRDEKSENTPQNMQIEHTIQNIPNAQSGQSCQSPQNTKNASNNQGIRQTNQSAQPMQYAPGMQNAQAIHNFQAKQNAPAPQIGPQIPLDMQNTYGAPISQGLQNIQNMQQQQGFAGQMPFQGNPSLLFTRRSRDSGVSAQGEMGQATAGSSLPPWAAQNNPPHTQNYNTSRIITAQHSQVEQAPEAAAAVGPGSVNRSVIPVTESAPVKNTSAPGKQTDAVTKPTTEGKDAVRKTDDRSPTNHGSNRDRERRRSRDRRSSRDRRRSRDRRSSRNRRRSRDRRSRDRRDSRERHSSGDRSSQEKKDTKSSRNIQKKIVKPFMHPGFMAGIIPGHPMAGIMPGMSPYMMPGPMNPFFNPIMMNQFGFPGQMPSAKVSQKNIDEDKTNSLTPNVHPMAQYTQAMMAQYGVPQQKYVFIPTSEQMTQSSGAAPTQNSVVTTTSQIANNALPTGIPAAQIENVTSEIGTVPKQSANPAGQTGIVPDEDAVRQYNAVVAAQQQYLRQYALYRDTLAKKNDPTVSKLPEIPLPDNNSYTAPQSAALSQSEARNPAPVQAVGQTPQVGATPAMPQNANMWIHDTPQNPAFQYPYTQNALPQTGAAQNLPNVGNLAMPPNMPTQNAIVPQGNADQAPNTEAYQHTISQNTFPQLEAPQNTGGSQATQYPAWPQNTHPGYQNAGWPQNSQQAVTQNAAWPQNSQGGGSQNPAWAGNAQSAGGPQARPDVDQNKSWPQNASTRSADTLATGWPHHSQPDSSQNPASHQNMQSGGAQNDWTQFNKANTNMYGCNGAPGQFNGSQGSKSALVPPPPPPPPSAASAPPTPLMAKKFISPQQNNQMAHPPRPKQFYNRRY